MVNVAVAIPWRDGDVRRKELFGFVIDWLMKFDAVICLGHSPDGPFNRGAAVNDAARQAGDEWDVLVVHDADTICDLDVLDAAVEQAAATQRVVYPYETYLYLDEFSSNRLMRQNNWFVAPELHPTQTFRTTVRHHHYSGVQVIPRRTYHAVGGYIEMPGWGAEDAIMDILFDVFAHGSQWLQGGAYHLWHEAKRNDPQDVYNVRNHQVLSRLKQMKQLNERNPQVVRHFMTRQGHRIP